VRALDTQNDQALSPARKRRRPLLVRLSRPCPGIEVGGKKAILLRVKSKEGPASSRSPSLMPLEVA